MPLSIELKRSVDKDNQGTLTVALDGSLDTSTSPQLERELQPALESQLKVIVFDLGKLKFISSAGLRVISMVRKRLKEREGQVVMVNMQPQIQEVFEIVKALPGIAIFKNLQELDDYLAERQRRYQRED